MCAGVSRSEATRCIGVDPPPPHSRRPRVRRTLWSLRHAPTAKHRTLVMSPHVRSSTRALCAVVTLATSAVAQGGGQQGENAATGRVQWDVTQARGKTRDIDFTTSEGTWM